MGDSIFEFADEFGIDSPFGSNWIDKDFKYGGTKKSLKIKFLYCKKDDNFYNLTFEIEAKNLKSGSAIIHVDESELINNEIAVPRKKVTINPNGIQKITVSFSKNKSFSQSILEGGFEFIGYITCDNLSSETAEFILNCAIEKPAKIKQEPIKFNKTIKIVIDPGHGYTKGSTGAVSFIYTYKVKNDSGKPQLNSSNNYITKSSDIMNLPEYVINNPDEWIVSKKEDPNHNERNLVFDISSQLKVLLEKKGFICFITRNSRVIVGNDDSKTRAARIDLANKNNVDYFISIHADGSENSNSTGSHVIYPKSADLKLSSDSKQFAIDVFKFYNVVNVEKSSPKEDVRGLQVLSASNKTKRKILIELGFVTSPKDAHSMFTNIDRIAEQLSEGIILNASKYF